MQTNPSFTVRSVEFVGEEVDVIAHAHGSRRRRDVMDGGQGYVTLVDCMPRLVPRERNTADHGVVQAARVSVNGGLKTPEDDVSTLRFMMRSTHCYDEQTEVLTDDGFVFWKDVKPGTRLGIWDDEAGTLCYEAPEYLTREDYSGPMYRVNHGGVDLLVTPHHKMYVRTRSTDGRANVWSHRRLIAAEELGDRSMVRYAKAAPFFGEPWAGEEFANHNDAKALLEFIGFFVGDGSADRTCVNVVRFHLKKPRKILYLHEIISRLGWKIESSDSYGGRKHIRVIAEGITKTLRQQCYDNDGNKVLPRWALMLDKDDAEALLIGLKNSDGSQKRGAWVYSTSSSTLAQQIQLVALHAGLAAHVNENSEKMFNVSMLSRMTDPVINQGAVNTSMVDYSGNVYCARTRTGILVVRRNGKIVLSGNTTPFEMVEWKFHCAMPIFVARQWIRHRTANVNEQSGRYSILPDTFHRPDAVRKQSGTNKQGSSGLVDDLAADDFLKALQHVEEAAYEAYEKAERRGVAKEQARIILPTSIYTQWYWKIDTHNLLHFLALRADAHAQYEIRVFAEAMIDLITPIMPETVRAWNDYHPKRGGMLLSRMEVELLKSFLTALPEEAGAIEIAGVSENKREQAEWLAKLNRLGLNVT